MAQLAVQTTMTANPDVARAGLEYDSSYHKDIVSCRAQEVIPFGSYVRIMGSDCEIPDTTSEVTASDGGIALATVTGPTQNGGYQPGDIVPVMRKGRVWVQSETALVVGNQPYVRFATNGGNVQGNLRSDADTANAVQKTGLTVYRGVAAAGLAVVSLD